MWGWHCPQTHVSAHTAACSRVKILVYICVSVWACVCTGVRACGFARPAPRSPHPREGQTRARSKLLAQRGSITGLWRRRPQQKWVASGGHMRGCRLAAAGRMVTVQLLCARHSTRINLLIDPHHPTREGPISCGHCLWGNRVTQRISHLQIMPGSKPCRLSALHPDSQGRLAQRGT